MQFMLYLFSVIHYCCIVILMYAVLCGMKLLVKIFSFLQALLCMLQKLIFFYLKYINEGARVVWSVEWPSYSLDDPGVKFWPGARDFSLHENIQNGSGGPWAFYLLILGTSSLVVNQPWHEAGHWPFYYINSTFFLPCMHLGLIILISIVWYFCLMFTVQVLDMGIVITWHHRQCNGRFATMKQEHEQEVWRHLVHFCNICLILVVENCLFRFWERFF